MVDQFGLPHRRITVHSASGTRVGASKVMHTAAKLRPSTKVAVCWPDWARMLALPY